MSSSDKELEQQLMEAGTRLMDPSPSVEELLPLLDQVENSLSKVEQSPSQSMQNALSPSLKALITEQIFRHPDADVKVAVASCISEITRITAPDAPYDDEQMKEVFQLIVSSFENLFDKSSRSYAKRTSILETVAKVRSCVVMLDLECDALIIEMFQHFFKTIRDYHPENVFASMETIMTLVLEESEDISMELLSPLLACVKRDNEEVMPVARKLAERVIKTCGDKLKPCLTEAVKTLGISLDDYSEVIASICQDASKNNSQDDDDDDDDDDAIKNQEVHENKPDIASLDGTVEDQNINPAEVNPAEEVDIPNEKSGKSSISNGSVQENDSLKDGNSEKQELVAVESNADAPTVHQSGVMPADNMVNSESAEKDTGKKGSTSVSLKSVEPSGSPSVNDNEDGSQHEKRCEDKNDPDAHNEDLSDTAVLSSENQEAMGDKSSLKDTESADDVGSPTRSSAGADDNINNKKTEDKRGMIEEAAAADIPKDVDADAPKTGSGEKSEMEENSSRLMKKKLTKQTEKKESTTEAEASDDDAPKSGLEGKSELETKSTRLMKKKVNKQTEKKEATTEAESSDDDASKTGLEGKSELETKSSRLMKKKPAAGTYTEDKTLSDIDETNGESSGASDLEAKLQLIKSQNEGKRDLKTKSSKHSGKKVVTGVSSEDKIQSANDETKEESGDASDVEVNEPKQPIMRKKGGTIDSEVKVSRRKGKKVAAGASIGKFLSVADETKEEEIDASDSESKPLKQSIKKANSRKQSGKKSVSKHPANNKKGSGGKDVLEKAEQQSSEKTDTEEMDISPKSFKENNDEPHLEETPKATPKRKPSGSKASRFVECNESLVGLKVKVWWPQDKMFYEGVVESFDRKKKRHKVLYDDGDQEILNMRTQRFEVIEDEDKPTENEGTDHASSDASPEMSPKKKMKTADKSTEKADLDASPKKARVASSSKTKVAVGKSGQKLHDAAKSGGNSKGGSKSGSKLENDSATQGNKTGSFKAAESSSKASGKPRNDDSITPKSSKSKDDAAGLQKSAKSKEDASRSAKSKPEVPKISSGKIPSTAAKSSGNGSNKRKSGVLKTTESDGVEELPKTPKSKSIKKRRR